MICYKIDVLAELKTYGYSRYRLKKDKLLSDETMQALSSQRPISMKSLDIICRLLDMQPGNIIRYMPESTQ